jgi:AcrR family transcriptional regulator
LTEAGVAQAREGGPEAIALREATRRAGVAPNAAYRHFANHSELVDAVRDEALAAAARWMDRQIQEAMSGIPEGKSKEQVALRARARLRAVGWGYLRFARAEPGLFRTAFAHAGGRAGDDVLGTPGPLNPFHVLSSALDDLVRVGYLPQERRDRAEYAAWSAVHGLAMLVTDGPLNKISSKELDLLAERLLDMIGRGI